MLLLTLLTSLSRNQRKRDLTLMAHLRRSMISSRRLIELKLTMKSILVRELLSTLKKTLNSPDKDSDWKDQRSSLLPLTLLNPVSTLDQLSSMLQTEVVMLSLTQDQVNQDPLL